MTRSDTVEAEVVTVKPITMMNMKKTRKWVVITDSMAMVATMFSVPNNKISQL